MSTGVIIGRFQPLHSGHTAVIKEALTVFDRVLVIVGSANVPRTVKNPWTAAERKAMIYNAFSSTDTLVVKEVDDNPDDVKWAQSLPALHNYEGEEITLIAPCKDKATTEYLDWIISHNPGIYSKSWSPSGVEFTLNSTDLRKVIFNPHINDTVLKQSLLPYMKEETITEILQWKYTKKDDYHRLCRELAYIERYVTEVKSYPRNEYTGDLCLINPTGDKVLMIRRGRTPGELLWAVPGGFVEQFETSREAAYREFQEETNCDLRLHSHTVVGSTVFDRPNRSPRARIATVVTYAQVHEDIKVSPTFGETLAVEWKTPDPRECFEDHYEIAMKGLELVR